MIAAKTDESSLIPTVCSEQFGTVSNRYELDRRNSQSWVPNDDNYGSAIFIGFDTEYTRREGQNQVLSYQYYSCLPDGRFEWEGIYYPAPRQRLKVAKFIQAVITDGLNRGTIKKWPRNVILVGHFTLADLTTFEDFEEYKTEFDAIRRTYVTISQDTTAFVYDLHRHKHKIILTLRDTILLAPAGKQSLRACLKIGLYKSA